MNWPKLPSFPNVVTVSIADLATTCFAVLLITGAILVIGEATERLRLRYGKFRTSAGIDSRAGLAFVDPRWDLAAPRLSQSFDNGPANNFKTVV